MKEYILERLGEPSTWRGIVWALTALGIGMDPERGEAIVTFGMALAGLLGIFLHDKKKEMEPTKEEIEIVKVEVEDKIEKKKRVKKNEVKTDSDVFLGD